MGYILSLRQGGGGRGLVARAQPLAIQIIWPAICHFRPSYKYYKYYYTVLPAARCPLESSTTGLLSSGDKKNVTIILYNTILTTVLYCTCSSKGTMKYNTYYYCTLLSSIVDETKSTKRGVTIPSQVYFRWLIGVVVQEDWYHEPWWYTLLILLLYVLLLLILSRTRYISKYTWGRQHSLPLPNQLVSFF